MSTIQPVILSGGAGTRLWPASRAAYPKQLQPLIGEHTMLQETALRARGRSNLARRLIVVCNEAHRFLVAEQLRAIEAEAEIVLEPEGRNTAPAVALAALVALRDQPEGSEPPILLVMPADHVIGDESAFLEALSVGEQAAQRGQLVTFGVVPSYPHTGYGYIETDAKVGETGQVRAFVEKPDKPTAVALLETNAYFWNAGIFMFRADVLLEELAKYAPEMVAACRKSVDRAREDIDFIRPDAEAFKASPSDSIDYAVMEKTDRSVMVPLDAGWSDVSSWAALHDLSQQDDSGNSISGDVLAIDCKKTFIRSQGRLVAAIGISNLVIVEDKDSVLVTHRKRSQDVRLLVEELTRQGREQANFHRQVLRPWGSYDSIDADDGFQVKRLIVNPGAVLSLQKHAHRAEHWVCVRGTARITRNEEVFDLGVNEWTYIAIGDVHRISNPGTVPVHIVEVQCGEYLGEDDIVRLEDNYGRQGTNT